MLPASNSCKRCKVDKMYVDFFGKAPPYENQKIKFSKSAVAQDRCTILCKAQNCHNIGYHRCGACEMASYCSEDCRAADRTRHQEDCFIKNAIKGGRAPMLEFKGNQDSANCLGIPNCSKPVESFCRHCLAAVCGEWSCSKYHLDHCDAYINRISTDWVMIDNPEAWVLVTRVRRTTRKATLQPQTQGGNVI